MYNRISTTTISTVLLIAAFICTASIASAADLPNPSQDDLVVDANAALTFELDEDAEILGTADADGNFATEEGGSIAPQAELNTYTYTPAVDFSGEDEFKYELCAPVCTEHTVTIQVDSVDSTLVIKGPEEGSSHTLSSGKDIVVAYGGTEPFKPVKLLVDGEEVGTANADGKGAWTRNLTFDEDDAGEHTLIAEDEDGNTTQVTFTIVWEEGGDNDNGDGNSGDDNGDADGPLPGEDPDVASAGGRAGSCASTHATPTSTGLGVLSLLVGLAFIRRRKRTRA